MTSLDDTVLSQMLVNMTTTISMSINAVINTKHAK